MYYSIDTILVTNGAIKYRDFTFPEVYEYDIKEILAIAENFRSDSSSISKITSQGKLREKGNYNAIMTVNPLYPLDFSIEFAVEGFQMADISPFALFYAGHPVFEGEMIYSGMTKVNQGVMKSDNKITVYDLQVGDKVSKNTLYAMPLKFAVFLLKDKNGVVNLDLPVEGNLEDPKFKFGPLIWQIIRQNAAKITAAPGRALASQFGLNEAELKYIDFPMLDSTLTDSAKITLDNLITLVNKKPGLIVDLKYYIPSEDEMNELALHQAKRFYLQTKLGINEEEKLHLAAEKLPDTDEHFTLFVNEKLETEGKPADSLSVVFIGMENLLGKMDQIRKNRESATLNYVRATDSLAVDKFIFSESDYFPEFPVSNTGYLVNFSIE